MTTLFYNGDKARYTGKLEILYGAKFFEIEMLEGANKGKKFDTSQCPDCNMKFGQDKRIPCHTCEVT